MSPATLMDSVWGGRALSQNSVSVVIGDLRRALGDNSRTPRYIETIPKRGYRLIAETDEQGPVVLLRPRRRRKWGLAIASAVLVTTVFAAQSTFSMADPPPISLSVEPFTNATGNESYDALAPALTDYAAARFGSAQGIDLQQPANGQWRLSGRIVSWNGQASLTMKVLDRRSGKVLLSVIAVGPPSQLPRQLDDSFGNFQKFVSDYQHGKVA